MLEEVGVLIERVVEEEAGRGRAVKNTVGVMMTTNIEVGRRVGHEGTVRVGRGTHGRSCCRVGVRVVVVRVVGVVDEGAVVGLLEG